MYKIDERIEIEIRFIQYGEYGEKIYEDKFGNTIVWFTNSKKLESIDWFKVTTKLYTGIDTNGEVKYYRLFNPRMV